jgi:hypothetical protein
MVSTEFKPGEWIAEKKAIFIGEFDDLVRADIPAPLAHTANLGLRTRWYDAALELSPDTFDHLVQAIARQSVNGRTGISFDPAAYEEKLFEAIRVGEAAGRYVLAPLAVVDEIHKLKRTGEYKRLLDGKLPGALRIDGGGTGFDRWQWSASSGRYGNENIRIVDFTDGYHGWDFRDGNLLSGRACFCEIVETGADKSARTRVAWAPPSASEIKSAAE